MIGIVPDYVSREIDSRVDAFISEYNPKDKREFIRQSMVDAYLRYGVIADIRHKEPANPDGGE